jgi:hypothetical protein
VGAWQKWAANPGGRPSREVRYCLIYYINIHVVYSKVVEVRSFRGDQSWWGDQLACMTDSLVNYVRDLQLLDSDPACVP